MTTPPPLSPAAQAVLDAMYEVNMDFGEENHACAAAVLRAVADRVLPIHRPVGGGFREHRSAIAERRENRRQLLAIAAELEGANG